MTGIIWVTVLSPDVYFLKCDAILKNEKSPVQLSTLKSRPQTESMTGIIWVTVLSPDVYFLKCDAILKNEKSPVQLSTLKSRPQIESRPQ